MNALVQDGYTNIAAGLGAANPKLAAHAYTLSYSPQYLETIYRASTWFGKIINIPADDAVKEWRDWQADKEQIQTIEAEEARLAVRVAVREAIIKSRLYGGSVIMPLGLPGAPASPLNMDRVGKGSLTSFVVLGREDIAPVGIIRNPLSPWYNKPEYWRLASDLTMMQIHPSRIILVPGRCPTPNNIWGDSEWQHMSDSVGPADMAAAILAGLMQESKVDVMRLPDFMAGFATAGYEELLMRRYAAANVLKSVSNMVLMDKDEEWEQKTVSFAGLPEVTLTLLTIMCGAADIPVTRLLGTSAKGLNATGEGDDNNYKDTVKAKQELEITPVITPLDEMLIRSAFGSRPDNIWYKWAPLKQMTEEERAKIDKTKAETTQIYANSGLFPNDALAIGVQNQVIEDGLYPGIEEALEESKLDPDILNPDPVAVDPETGLPVDPSKPVPVPPKPAVADRVWSFDPRGPRGPQGMPGHYSVDAAPRSLYVRRDVVNKAEITAWARAQGFTDILDDLHVTIMYSSEPVDWMKVGETWSGSDRKGQYTIEPGGARLMDTFGEGAKVLLFNSSTLAWRHEEMKNAGAVPSHSEYQPHITITYGAMPENVIPYRGKIVLGPEIFEEVKQKRDLFA